MSAVPIRTCVREVEPRDVLKTAGDASDRIRRDGSFLEDWRLIRVALNCVIAPEPQKRYGQFAVIDAVKM
jgi:hypothetical protein